MNNQSDLAPLIERIKTFTTDRDWKQFHNPKDLAISLMMESSEVLEHFQWKNAGEIKRHLVAEKEAISDELADVLVNVLLMCHYFDIDIIAAAHTKMAKNEAKYPIEKARGNHKKYTEHEKDRD